MSESVDILPPKSPCFCCRDPEPNAEAVAHYLRQQREWIHLGRRGKPAVGAWLERVCASERFSGSVVVDANDPWVDELIEFLPAGPERLLLYADMAALVEFFASLSDTARVRVCFALGTPDDTGAVLEGRRDHWMACCYAGSESQWACAEEKRASKPGDLVIAHRDDLENECIGFDSGNMSVGPHGKMQRLVMRLVREA